MQTCNKNYIYRLGITLILLIPLTIFAAQKKQHHTQLAKRHDVQAFIHKMTSKHKFSHKELVKIFNHAKFLPQIVKKMNHPYEAEPWDIYLSHFATNYRIANGAKYWLTHAKALTKAYKIYGVPPAIIVSIIGIESMYGEDEAEFSTLNALTTLSFKFPKRAKFFQAELEQYLLLTKELNLDPIKVRGSYAGALGLPQFMPSSYRHFAVDFNGNNKKDLLNNTADVVGSVANYLFIKGWRKREPIAIRADVTGSRYKKVLTKDLQPEHTLKQIEKYGVKPQIDIHANLPANLIELTNKNGTKEYWIAFNNLYVITKYNINVHYALTALLLSKKIAAYYNKFYNSFK